MGSEEFLNQMVEALDITIDRRPKGRPFKMNFPRFTGHQVKSYN